MKRVRIAVVVIAAAAIAAFFLFRDRGDGASLAASGTVEVTEASLGFQAAGRITRLPVNEGDRVKPGDTLAVLDRTELRAREAQAQAQENAARAALAELERGARSEELAQALEADSAAAARLADAQRDLARAQQLFRGGAASQEAYDKARLAADVARSQREQAAQQLRLVRAGPRAERIAAQRAVVASAEALRRQVDAQLANAVITAPFAGVVTVRHRQPGEIVAPGAPVVTLANFEDRWVRIYVSETRLGAVAVGQSAAIASDTYPDRRYAGTVSFIASEAEFTPRNVQTTEERVKLVYAVKVRITGDTALALKPGMPADVTLTLAK
ncbi:MAG: HlyD family efflux transporter periplasmic adaptor subunit [Gemmatimonadetes bacterium]|nr:HlyD family efflux transporter periplasmic adaptor subunit [Gemmatimonadota bacterium]